MSSFSPVTDRVLLLRVFVGVCPHFCAGSVGGHGGVLVLGIYIQIPCDSMSSFSEGALRRIFPPRVGDSCLPPEMRWAVTPEDWTGLMLYPVPPRYPAPWTHFPLHSLRSLTHDGVQLLVSETGEGWC